MTSNELSEEITKKVPKYVRSAEGKLGARQLRAFEKRSQEAARKAASYEILLTEEPGYLEAEGLEKTFNITQKSLKENVDEITAAKIFNLDLKTFGPYSLDYTRNGRNMLIGGHKGHIATLDWQANKMNCEIHVKETVRDVNGLFTFDGILFKGNAGWLKYQDTSTGKLVAECRTKLGRCDVMVQNLWNAIINLGHSNGTVTLWSPNMTTPLVKMLTHRGPVKALAVDHTGNYMASAGLDGRLKLWDIRTYKCMHEYFTRTPASSLSISQLGLLGVGWVLKHFILKVWKDAFKAKQKSPYMNHLQPGTQIQDINFCPYEDILGFGHSDGISSILIPGSGEPNIDSLEVNPYQTKRQRQETEVHGLLDKIQPEMITLDPTFIGNIDKTSKEMLAKEHEEEHKDKGKKEPRHKTRGKNRSLKRYLRKKQKNIIDDRRVKIQQRIEKEKEARRKRLRGEVEDNSPPTALD
ncbi:17526_t:CDS:10, partial [Acaulospora colombiana]